LPPRAAAFATLLRYLPLRQCNITPQLPPSATLLSRRATPITPPTLMMPVYFRLFDAISDMLPPAARRL